MTKLIGKNCNLLNEHLTSKNTDNQQKQNEPGDKSHCNINMSKL